MDSPPSSPSGPTCGYEPSSWRPPIAGFQPAHRVGLGSLGLRLEAPLRLNLPGHGRGGSRRRRLGKGSYLFLLLLGISLFSLIQAVVGFLMIITRNV